MSNKVIIGIDPDSEKNGVAVYIKGKLTKLKSMSLPEIMELFIELQPNVMPFELHIEDVCGNNAPFISRKKFYSEKSYIAAVKSTCRKVGLCQQAQKEVERMSEHFGIKVVRHKISDKWKSADSKKVFELTTGWKGRSNEDTRSAAYFGFLGCK